MANGLIQLSGRHTIVCQPFLAQANQRWGKTNFGLTAAGLGFVQFWLLGIENSTSTELMPGQRVLATLRERLANCTAVEQHLQAIIITPHCSPSEREPAILDL